jgi:phage N-6-adenine-methyltransferase
VEIATFNPVITLPGLVTRAAAALAGATTSAEVLDARELASAAYDVAKRAGRLARAKQAHDELIKAVYRAQDDALEIEAAAKRRLADEYDAAQDRGEVAGQGRPKNISDENVFVSDLGLSAGQIHEARQLRDAEDRDPGIIRRALDDRIGRGEEPTKASVREAIVNRTSFTGNNEWFTPDEYIELARAVLGGIDLDPATHRLAQKKVKAAEFFTEEDDGLRQEWFGRVWLNPPYAQPFIAEFVSKLVREVRSGTVSAAIMLTHNYTDTAWFHEAAGVADAICFTRGRVKFYNPAGETAAPTQGQAFFYYGSEVKKFAETFRSIGFIVNVNHGEA